MRLSVQLKLLPTPEQADALTRILVRANEFCNAMSQMAWQARSFKQFDIHRLCYNDTRKAFGLAAQVVARCISKVVDAYKLDKAVQRLFKPLGALPFDDRILSFKSNTISIWTLECQARTPLSEAHQPRNQ